MYLELLTVVLISLDSEVLSLAVLLLHSSGHSECGVTSSYVLFLLSCKWCSAAL